MGQHFGSAVDAGRANPGFAGIGHAHVDFAVRAMEQGQAVARVATTHKSVNDLLGFLRKRTMAVFVARIVVAEEFLPMVDQNPPQRTLMG